MLSRAASTFARTTTARRMRRRQSSATQSNNSDQRSLWKVGGGFAKRVASITKTSLALIGFGTTAGAFWYYREQQKFIEEESKDRKRVLVLPFNRLKFVKKYDNLSRLRMNEESLEEIEVQALVDIIHEAAADPNVVAIFGEFGGRSFSGGTADAEEIRNALRVFRESHRSHLEPNLSYQPAVQRANSRPRSLYAYADTFESPERPDNPDYYIASIFTHIHLQKQGALNLFGFSSSVPFFRQMLEKYGARVHVYKHGHYKNSPNSFTETGFTKHHRKNVETYLFALNNYMCDDITKARKGLQLSGDMWKLIHNSGTFTALSAMKMGFVDYAPERSPLESLLAHRKAGGEEDDEKVQKLKAEWGTTTDLESFQADEMVSLSKYRNIVAQRRELDNKKWRVWSRLKDAAEKNPLASKGLALAGFADPFYNLKEGEFQDNKARAFQEKIALIKINGAIDGKKVRKILPSLERIKTDKNIKCVVVQVSSPGGTIDASETLLQEFKSLPQKVVFSFGNVSASGGYYIASHADYIFASKNTITGSIGVFGVRLDLSEAANQYGVKFGHISTSDLALSNNIFFPPTKKIHENSSRMVDRAYQRFKEVVATGRNLEEDYLDTIAEGRVWSGEQARNIGLVDEIGGLNRAIAFARRNYTSGDAKVVQYTDDEGYLERIRKLLGKAFSMAMQNDTHVSFEEWTTSHIPYALMSGVFPNVVPKKSFGLFLTVDENTAVQSILRQEEWDD